MKEFNLILDKVSQALGTTVDNVVKLYPQLRTEYSWYYLCDNLQAVSFIILVAVLAVSAVILIPPLAVADPDDEDYQKAVKFTKWSLMILAALTVVCVVSTALKGFMCPDILIIERFIK